MSQYEYDTENISIMTVSVSITLKTISIMTMSQYEPDTGNISIMTVRVSMMQKTSALWLYKSMWVWHWKHQHYDYMSQYEYDTENISIMTIWVNMTLKTPALWLYETIWVWLWKHHYYDCTSMWHWKCQYYDYETVRVWHWKHQYCECTNQYDTENISIMTAWVSLKLKASVLWLGVNITYKGITLKTSVLWLYESVWKHQYYDYESIWVWHWKHKYYDCMNQFETENISVMTVQISMTLKTLVSWLYESVSNWKKIIVMTVSVY